MFGLEDPLSGNLEEKAGLEAIAKAKNIEILEEFGKIDDSLLERIKTEIAEVYHICKPDSIWVISGDEVSEIRESMVTSGKLLKLNQKTFPNCYLYRSDPRDVARTEKDTYICTSGTEEDAGPTNNWMHVDKAKEVLLPILRDSMKGRTMYVIPYWLGPFNSPYGQGGIEITDSPYVVINMDIMVRAGENALKEIFRTGRFVFGVHSSCDLDPERRYICHFPEQNLGDGLIVSVNSGYGGNALLSKKCHALRIAGVIAKREAWMAEHMMLIGVKTPDGRETFISGAFPSASGKTNLSMLEPPEFFTNRGWKTSLMSDDIIWMHERKGRLNCINPEKGFFGVLPNTNSVTNPNALKAISSNTIFTNAALTREMEPYWEGLGPVPDGLIDWQGKPYDGKGKAAQANSRFTTPASNYPHLSQYFDSEMGVPLSIILYGGRRKDLIPLIYMSFNWNHGVLIGAMQRVETTAAIVGKVGVLRNDPMANIPFVGYNMADYFSHHLEMGKRVQNPPKIFNVNWFRTDSNGDFIWPGYGYNMFALKWAIDMYYEETDNFVETPIGYLPTVDAFKESGVDQKKLKAILTVDRDGFLRELEEVKPFLESFGEKLPKQLWDEYYNLKERLESWKN